MILNNWKILFYSEEEWTDSSSYNIMLHLRKLDFDYDKKTVLCAGKVKSIPEEIAK